MEKVKASSIIEMVVASLIILFSVIMAFQVPSLQKGWGKSCKEIRNISAVYLCDSFYGIHAMYRDSTPDEGIFIYRLYHSTETEFSVLKFKE